MGSPPPHRNILTRIYPAHVPLMEHAHSTVGTQGVPSTAPPPASTQGLIQTPILNSYEHTKEITCIHTHTTGKTCKMYKHTTQIFTTAPQGTLNSIYPKLASKQLSSPHHPQATA